MTKVDVSNYSTFDQITDRLDQIVSQVKSKDTSIEHSLELFDEAIALGSKAVDMVDTAPLSDAEKNKAQQKADSSSEGEATAPSNVDALEKADPSAGGEESRG